MDAADRADAIARRLGTAGVELVASLPDSWLAELVDRIESERDIRHVRVTREDDGAGVCAGAALGGKRAALLCQNAGVLLATNALAGYALHHQLPFLVLAVLRGDRDDSFYYQSYKGTVTRPVLDALGVPWHHLRSPADDSVIEEAMQQAWLARRPVVVLCSKLALVGEES